MKKFQKDKITGKDSICSKQLKLKNKKRNKPTYGSENKTIFVQNFRPLFITFCPAIVLWTHYELKIYIYACAEFLEGKQIMEAEKMW